VETTGPLTRTPMIDIDFDTSAASLAPRIAALWELSAVKLRSLEASWPEDAGSPVFTVDGRYATRGWTDWTRGFQHGSALLHFKATGDEELLEVGRRGTLEGMVPHLVHFGVHDHGFNTVSTWGNLRRLVLQGKVAARAGELERCELAIRVSGAVQAKRWTKLRSGGFIHSFNGPHSLFADTMRTLRVLALAHTLGGQLQGENDVRVSLLMRLVEHAHATATWTVYHGQGRDAYDTVRGRVAHESCFDTIDGRYRSPATQQGYSPFSTWTRGLAWVLLGFAEELEFLATLGLDELEPLGGPEDVEGEWLRAARATADFWLEHSPTDGVPYWDTGAPGLARLEGWRDRPSDPFNDHEPVDSSAAVIAAQGLIRLGGYLDAKGAADEARRYRQAGLTIAGHLFAEPYLATDPEHQGLILHSIYHRPAGWDRVPAGAKIPRGESSMWGDYHARELAVLIESLEGQGAYHAFFAGGER